MIIGRDPGALTNLIAVGPSPYLGELLSVAGGTNVLTGKAIDYPHISMETVVRLNPDVILDLSRMGDGTQDFQLSRPWLSQKGLAAVQKGMVFGIASEVLVTPGPRAAEGVELLRTELRQAERR
jgi:iron complex transport system substrate-binding protein